MGGPDWATWMRLDHHLRALAVALGLASSPAFAGYALATPPAGFGGTSAQWTYKAANAETWLAQSVRTSAALNVGGRTVQLGAKMTLAANAAQYVVAATRLNPAALATGAVATWLLGYGLKYLTDHWVKEEPGEPSYTCVQNPETCSPSGALAYLRSVGYTTAAMYQVTMTNHWVANGLANTSFSVCRWNGGSFGTGVCEPWSSPVVQGNIINTLPTTPVQRPATESDWNAPKGATLPDSVANGYPEPLPVALPKLNPDPAPWPQPLPVPLGDPVPAPGTVPQKYEQPVADVKPSPTPAEPWRVDVQPRTAIGEDPNGIPDPTGTTTEPAPGTAPEQKTLCETDPTASACAPLGSPPGDQPITATEVPLSITKNDGFGPSNASCPAPRSEQLSNAGMTLSFSYESMCTVMTGIRPVIIGLAYISAALGFIGFARRD